MIQAAPEACEPHTSEPWHHHNMDTVVQVGEVPLLLSAKWQVSNINVTVGSGKPTTLFKLKPPKFHSPTGGKNIITESGQPENLTLTIEDKEIEIRQM